MKVLLMPVTTRAPFEQAGPQPLLMREKPCIDVGDGVLAGLSLSYKAIRRRPAVSTSLV